MARPSRTSTIRIAGPDVADMVRTAWSVYTKILAGEWEIIGEIFSDRWIDPEETATAFGMLGRQAVPHPTMVTDVVFHGEGDEVVYNGRLTVLCEVMELYMRLHLGQFHTIAAYSGARHEIINHPFMLETLRVQHQRENTWPESPAASNGIPTAPKYVKRVHDVWKQLGGGMASRGVILHDTTVEIVEGP